MEPSLLHWRQILYHLSHQGLSKGQPHFLLQLVWMPGSWSLAAATEILLVLSESVLPVGAGLLPSAGQFWFGWIQWHHPTILDFFFFFTA